MIREMKDSGIEWIGEVPKHWSVRRISTICELIMGQSPSSDSYNDDGLGMPFFQGKADFGNISPVVRHWCDEPTKISEVNDILVSVRAPV